MGVVLACRFERGRWRIFVGDEVVVNHGPFRAQSGKVLQVIQDTRVPQVVVQGVNLVSEYWHLHAEVAR
jgi:ribosomal protein L24